MQNVFVVAQVKQGDIQAALTLQSLLPPISFPSIQVTHILFCVAQV